MVREAEKLNRWTTERHVGLRKVEWFQFGGQIDGNAGVLRQKFWQ